MLLIALARASNSSRLLAEAQFEADSDD